VSLNVVPGSRSTVLAVLRGRSFGALMRSGILRCIPPAPARGSPRPGARPPLWSCYGTALLS